MVPMPERLRQIPRAKRSGSGWSSARSRRAASRTRRCSERCARCRVTCSCRSPMRPRLTGTALALGHGQMISQPYIVAFMAEALRLRGDDRVLEIGTGSGYQTAVLAQLARDVFSIEIVKPLAERAAAKLKNLGYANVQVRVGDGYQGWPEHAPYDAILVSAAPDHIPQPLLDQLAVGGRMILPVGKKFSQSLLLIHRTHSGYERTTLLPVAFVPMTGEAEAR